MGLTTPKYPTTVTQKYWDKEKGTLAKLKGKTGVGEACSAAEKAFDNIPWGIMGPMAVFQSKDFDAGKSGGPEQASAKVYADLRKKHVAPVVDALEKVISSATEAMKEYDKKGPNSSAHKAADTIKTDATELKKTLENEKFWSELVDEAAELWQEQKSIRTVKFDLSGKIEKFETLLIKSVGTFIKDPNEPDFNNIVKICDGINKIVGGLDDSTINQKWMSIYKLSYERDFGKLGDVERKAEANIFAKKLLGYLKQMKEGKIK